MRVLIMGGDGYLGWPTAMSLASKGHEIMVVDNYLRRNLARETCSEALIEAPNLNSRVEIFGAASGKRIEVRIGDCSDGSFLENLFREFVPDAAVHYAEQPSAPYSMRGHREAKLTLENNLGTTFALIWAALKHAPDCHIVKLGTMGEYGVPNIDIEEGWIEIDHKGRTEKFLYPRQAGSLYHTTKVLDTDLLWFYVRIYGLRVTDLMQGPVYGISTTEADLDDRLLPAFHYDDIFGTVVNRFVVQALAGVPLTVYGEGGQVRGYLNIRDTLQCIELAVLNPVARGEMRILNQFTQQFSVLQLAEIVQRAGRAEGLDVRIQSIRNPRKEKESHYYNAAHTGLLELGLRPTHLTDDLAADLLRRIARHKSRIDAARIMPRVVWSNR